MNIDQTPREIPSNYSTSITQINQDWSRAQLETTNKRIDYVEKEIDSIKDSLKSLKEDMEKSEKDIMSQVEKNQNDIKALLKEKEITQRENTSKLFTSIEKLTDSQHQQTLMQKDIQNELRTTVRDFTELANDMKDNDKWKTRTIAGFVISIILMIIGTFWKMLTVGFLLLPFL